MPAAAAHGFPALHEERVIKAPYVYILASRPRGTLYIGVTSNLMKRIWQHRRGVAPGFTRRYGVKTLVWYERQGTMIGAIEREKTLKKWRRQWKVALIETRNPDWHDLWNEVFGDRAILAGFPLSRE